MHVNAENLYVEVLNDGRPAGPGETGELVITDLSNFGAPFIRYKIGDVGKFAPGRCSCGRALPLLESVEGRVYDLIACPNGTVQTGTFFCKVTRSFEGIQEFQVIQESDQRIRLKLVTEDKFESESVVSIRNMIKVHCGEEMDVAFEFVDRLEPLKSGKRRYIVSLASASGGEPPSYTLQARKNNHG
jgi:phenylacetate-CoA ligase